MIDLEKGQIVLGKTAHQITGFGVWWAVDAFGLYPDLEEALALGRPIMPAPVALADGGMYELLPAELSAKIA